MMPRRPIEKRSRRRPEEPGPEPVNAPLWRLVVRVAPEDAEVTGALLVQEGAGGAVEESLPHEAHVACFGEDRA